MIYKIYTESSGAGGGGGEDMNMSQVSETETETETEVIISYCSKCDSVTGTAWPMLRWILAGLIIAVIGALLWIGRWLA